jgi:hypothetical protein
MSAAIPFRDGQTPSELLGAFTLGFAAFTFGFPVLGELTVAELEVMVLGWVAFTVGVLTLGWVVVAEGLGTLSPGLTQWVEAQPQPFGQHPEIFPGQK